MRFLRSLLPSVLVLGAGIVEAASSWNFEEASISVSGKGAGVGAGFKDKYVATPPYQFDYHILHMYSEMLIEILQIVRSSSAFETSRTRPERYR